MTTSEPPGPRWRESEPRDDVALEPMMLALYVEDPADVPMTLAKARGTLAALRAAPSRGVAVVCEDAGHLVAYALLCAFWSNEVGGALCVIDELYVAPAWRGRGLATAFVADLRDRRTPWFEDAVALELEVTPDNRRARRLYERLGFAPCKNAMLRAACR
jgi:GNAT superfamily N-acetyltransferase